MKQIKHTADIFRVGREEDQNKIVLESHHGKMTYGELDKYSNQIANGLLAKGLKKGNRIAILDKNSIQFAVIIGGILKACMVPILINFRLGPSEVDYIIKDGKAELLFIGPDHFPQLEEIQRKFTGLKTVTFSGEIPGQKSLDDFKKYPSDDPNQDHYNSDIVLQLYTSGTTGYPKGACFTDEAYLAASRQLVSRTGLVQEGDIQLIAMPMCHVAAYNLLLFGLQYGVKSVIIRDIVPESFLSIFPQYQITTTLLAPAIIQLMMTHPKVKEVDFTALRCLFYGSAPISAALLDNAREILDCDFGQLYGMTENCGVGTYLAPEDHDAAKGKLRSCGREYSIGSVRIADQNNRECTAGETGEIQTRGNWMMSGYWNLPQETEKSYQGEWFCTGDAGYRDEEGYIFIQDRIKDMIITGGENVYPIEVENIMSRHPAVLECAIFGVPDDKWGEAIRAVVVLNPGMSSDEETIISWLREQIAHFKIPKAINFAPCLPRNAVGKVLKKDLRSPYWKGKKRAIN